MSSELRFEHLAPVYNEAVNEALGKHYFGEAERGADIAAMSDDEFKELRLTGDVQPINPVDVLAREMNVDPETVTSPQINEFLRDAWQTLLQDYRRNGIDALPTIQAATNIISHTEAYITGYSRDIGIQAARVLAVDPRFTGPMRWHAKTWVVDEDIHDRAATLQNQATGMLPPRAFYDEHRVHMIKGVHVTTDDPIQTTAFVTTQEGVTVPSYTGQGVLLGPVLGLLPEKIRTNEAEHFSFYRRVIRRLLDHFPDETIVAIHDANHNFQMPGKEGIPNYEVKSLAAATAGVLDPGIVIGVQRRIFKQLKIAERTFTSDEAKQAQEALLDPKGEFGEETQARFERGIAAARRRAIRRREGCDQPLPAIIGMTVVKDGHTKQLSFPKVA